MKRAAGWMCGMAVALAALQAGAQTAVKTKSGLRVADTTFSPNEWTQGCIARRFEIENVSPVRRTVTIELPGGTYSGHSTGIDSLSGTVTVEPGARAVLSLVQPPVALRGDDRFAVRVPGLAKETFRSPVRDFQAYTSRPTVSLLLARALSGKRLKERLTACAPDEKAAKVAIGKMTYCDNKKCKGHSQTATHYTRQNMESLQPLRLERDLAGWSTEWLAYTCFQACLVTGDEFAKMPLEVRQALRDYVSAGGLLTVTGPGDLELDWPFAEAAWREAESVPGVKERAFGFGRVQRVADVSQLSTNQLAWLAEAWYARKEPWRQDGTFLKSCLVPDKRLGRLEDCVADIPVKLELGLPVNVFLLLLLVFVLLAGPGAVCYTCRVNRRIRLLWLVPAFSVGCSLVIVVFALLSEGVTPETYCQAVTLLDQARRQAVTLGAVGVYAPVTVGGGLQFERGTEVTPLLRSEFKSGASLAWGQHQHFASGWVMPRVPSYFRVRRSEARSERLVVTPQGEGQVEVVNALGVPLRRLALCDAGGWQYVAEGVAPGEKRVLRSERRRTEKDGAPAFERLRAAYMTTSPGWGVAALVGHALAPDQKVLGTPGAGSYLAVLDGCPFIENPLAYRAVSASASALVAGTF